MRGGDEGRVGVYERRKFMRRVREECLEGSVERGVREGCIRGEGGCDRSV